MNPPLWSIGLGIGVGLGVGFAFSLSRRSVVGAIRRRYRFFRRRFGSPKAKSQGVGRRQAKRDLEARANAGADRILTFAGLPGGLRADQSAAVNSEVTPDSWCGSDAGSEASEATG